jgi:hypothetical protein
MHIPERDPFAGGSHNKPEQQLHKSRISVPYCLESTPQHLEQDCMRDKESPSVRESLVHLGFVSGVVLDGVLERICKAS